MAHLFRALHEKEFLIGTTDFTIVFSLSLSRLPSPGPRFFAAVVTTLGELGPELAQHREWSTSTYAKRLEREAPRDDGRSRAAKFRNKFNFRMRIGVARGQTKMNSA